MARISENSSSRRKKSPFPAAAEFDNYNLVHGRKSRSFPEAWAGTLRDSPVYY